MGENKLSARQSASLERLTQAKEGLLDAIEGLEEETLCSEPVVGVWTIKDVLGHLVSWNKEFRENIAMILEGMHPGYDHLISDEQDFSDSNQVWYEEKKDWPWERILAEFEGDYQEAVELIQRLTPKDLRQRGVTPWKEAAISRPQEPSKRDTDAVNTLVNFHWRHMNMHLRQIEKWRKGRGIPDKHIRGRREKGKGGRT